MATAQWDHELFKVILAEHLDLADTFASLHSAIDRDDRTKNGMEDLVTQLSDQVDLHFEIEERDGYLREALEQSPRHTTQAELLLKQHDDLREEIEKLRILIHSGVESSAWWTQVKADIRDFSTKFFDHEHAEDQLLQAAYTDDLGAGD